MGSSSLILAKKASFSYNNSDNYILKDISMRIKRGEFISIIGGNGSGKSTLAKSLNGLFIPNKGDILVLGKNSKEDKEAFNIRRNVGLVFQNPDNQIIASIVEEDVAFGPENLGIKPSKIKENVEKALKSVNMYAYKDEIVHKLSGGQKQRVSIAGILAMEPKCIILDESTSMLDPQGRQEIMDVIHYLKEEKNIGIILITHFMEEARDADRVIVMEDGKIIKDSTPEDIFSNYSFLKEHNLYAPECTEFMFKLKDIGFNINKYGTSVDECVNILDNFIKENKNKKSKINISKTSENGILNREDKLVIEATDLGYTYDKKSKFENKALKNINFSVYEGEVIGIIGKTGSGKSTLVNQINGILKPTSGRISVQGRIGMVFQYPEYQLFEENVYKDIAFGPKNMGKSTNDIDKLVLASTKFVGLGNEILYKSPFELSGGEKRKVAIAGIIATDPDILILDEPCAGLDPKSREKLLSKIISYHRIRNNTIILVSHYMDDIAKYVDRVIMLNEGNLESYLSVEETFMNQLRLKEIGLDIPTISKIMNKLSYLGHEIKQGIIDYNEAVDSIINNLN